MDDFEGPEDPTLMQVEALCNLADAYKAANNSELKKRLLTAMDLVILRLCPPIRQVAGPRGQLIDVTNGHGPSER
jgi:hypothetical protein